MTSKKFWAHYILGQREYLGALYILEDGVVLFYENSDDLLIIINKEMPELN
jgi:hypothetical protein